jgi:uncharacterized YccA/Bax inhibitor family protein
MRAMSNPVLNDRAFEKIAKDDGRAGWAAPNPANRAGNAPLGLGNLGSAGTAGVDAATRAPYTDGPVTPYTSVDDRMTRTGTKLAIGVLFALFLAAATFGWLSVSTTTDPLTGAVQADVPGWLIIAAIGGLILALVGAFVPKATRITGPLYALAQGAFVGAISHLFNADYPGIVLQAVGATAAVFFTMWFLYTTGIIKVTEKLRMAIVAATLGVLLMYVVMFLVSLFSDANPINAGGPLGILVSVVVAGVAAFNLLLDFDMIDRGVEAGMPKYMEWYCAFGLLVTVVWLYLEILRLLAKLREN